MKCSLMAEAIGLGELAQGNENRFSPTQIVSPTLNSPTFFRMTPGRPARYPE